MKQRDDLYVRVIRSKYKCGSDVIPTINKQRVGSKVWVDIKATQKGVCEGIELVNGGQDVKWKWEKHGAFSFKYAYYCLSKKKPTKDMIWGKLWKLNIPRGCKSFMWLVLHNRLLTNKAWKQRKMNTDG